MSRYKCIVAATTFLILILAFFAATPVNAETPSDDVNSTEWGVPVGATELVEERSQHGKRFSNPDGSFTEVIGLNLHYQDDTDQWQLSDPLFVFDGTDSVMDRHPVFETRVSNQGVTVTAKDTGKGIHWITPRRPNVGQNKASFTQDGLMWIFANTSAGIKAEATVEAMRGPQTYRFNYVLQGDLESLTPDIDGNLIGDGFVIPRAFVIGANGKRYDTSVWELVGTSQIKFTFDDTDLPIEAYPYVIDPTTTFTIGASDDDGTVEKESTSYPPTGSVTVSDTTATDDIVKRKAGSLYTERLALDRWDTSSLPDSATVTAATLRVRITSIAGDADARNLVGEWYVFTGSLSSGDYSTPPQGSDAYSVDISNLVNGQDNDITLSDVAANINLTGNTGIRHGVSGGTPTGSNGAAWASFNHASLNPARLLVTYTDPSAAVTGTIGDGATEQEVRDGGGTIILTLTDTTWVATGATFDAQRQNIIDGLDAADAQSNGWNAEVRDKLGVSSVVRTSDTIATITISASDVEDYHITTNEVITATVPSTATAASGALVATPTITITAGAESVALTGTVADGATPAEIEAGGQTAILTLTNTKWVASGSTFNAQRQNIIDGFVSAGSDTNGWNNRRSDFAVTDVVRTSDTIVTVTFSASANYAIGAAETITVTVPATAMVLATSLVATPTFTITPSFVSSGTWVSPAINLSSITDTAYCALGWSVTTPTNTTALVEYSSNGGSSYSTATNGQCPFSITSSLSAVSDFRIKITLGTSDSSVSPSVTALGFVAGTTGGQTVRYQLNTTPALTIDDRTGNGYTGAFSFPSQPDGVATTVGAMTALSPASAARASIGVPQITSPVTGVAVSSNLFNLDETGWAELPGYDIVNTMATAGDGLPAQFIWYIFLGFITIMLGFFALNLTQSIFAAGAAMALGISASIAIGGGLMPGWTIFVFLPIALGLVLLRPRLAI